MGDLTKKQYLDLAGLKAFWGIIKDNFVSEVSLSMPVDGPAVFISKDGLGNETNIGTIPMADTTKAGLMSKEQVAALDAVSGNIEATVSLKGVAFAGNAATIASIGAGEDVKAKHVNLDVKYDSVTKTIQVVDLNNDSAVLTSFDATAFIKDSFLSGAEISEKDGKTGLLLTFTLLNPETGETEKEPIFVDLTSFVDTYNAGNGLSVADKVFSVKLVDGEKYLTVGENGLATTGIDDAITTAAGDAGQNAKDYADTQDAATLADAKGYTDDEVQKAKEYADGLKAAVDGVIEENERVTAEALTDLDERVIVLEAIDHDAYKDYVNGEIGITDKTVKAYVDEADADVLAAANGYADSSSNAVYAAIEAIPVADITLENLNA